MGILDKIKEHKLAFGGASVVALGALAWLAFGFFGIQAAFIDNVVEEDGPVFTTSAEVAEESAEEEAPASEPEADEVAEVPEPEPTEEEPVEAAPAEEAVEEEAVEETVEQEPVEAPVEEEPAPVEEEPVEEAEQNEPGEIATTFSGNFSSLGGYSVEGEAAVLSNGTEQRFLRFENFVSDNGPDLKVYLRASNGEFVSLGDLTGNIGSQNYEIPVDVDLSVFSNVEIWCERFSAGFGVATLTAA